MALDTRLALLAGQSGVDTATPLQTLYQGQRQEKMDERALKTQDLQDKMTVEQLASAKLQNLNAREKSRLQSSIYGLAELNTHLGANDIEGARGFLNTRKANLEKRRAAGEDIDTNETDQALQLLDSNPEQLKRIADQGIKFGQMTGILQMPKAGYHQGGGTGFLVDRLMQENPNLGYADALAQVQSGFRQGVTYQGGQAMPTAGYAETRAGTEGQIAGAKQTAQNQSDLQYKPQIQRDTSVQKELGTAQGKTLAGLPSAVAKSQMAIDNIDQLLEHPGLQQSVGLIDSKLPSYNADIADFRARADQLKGTAFLQAFEVLRGGGQITEAEGQKATDAIARMDQAQSDEAYIQAFLDFRDAIETGLGKLQQVGSGNFTGQPSQPQQQQQNQIKFLGFE